MNLDITTIPVYCISISQAHRRRIKKILQSHGFTDIRIIEGVQGQKKVTGVAMAHEKALGIALEECDGPFIIIEEDIQVGKFTREIFLPEYTDAIYLGISSWGLRNGHGENDKICFQKTNGGLCRVFNMLAAHAILYVNHDYARFIHANIPMFIEMGTNQDKLRAETMKYFNIYAVNNAMFYQGGRFEKTTRFKFSDKISTPLSQFYL